MRTSRELLLVTIGSLGLVLAACGGGSSPTTAKTTVPGATTTVAGATTTTAAATTTAAPTTTVKTYTANELKGLLLTLQDLPVGWSIDPDQSNPDDATPFAGCPSLSALDKLYPSTAKANIDITKGTNGPFAGEKLEAYTGDIATKGMAALGPAAAACPVIKATNPDGTVYDLTMGEMSFPKVGDESKAFRLGGTINDTPVDGQFIYARKGAMVAAISAVAVNGDKVDLTELQKIAEAAVNKLP